MPNVLTIDSMVLIPWEVEICHFPLNRGVASNAALCCLRSVLQLLMLLLLAYYDVKRSMVLRITQVVKRRTVL